MNFIFDERQTDSPLVETVWRTQSEGGGSFISLAETHWEMVVTKQKGQTTFTVPGPETKARRAPIPKNAEFLGIVFKLGTFMPHLPVNELVDEEINLPEATGQSFWLRGAAWEIPDFENADTFVARLAREELLVRDPVVEAVLQNQPSEFSLRTVQHRFLRATGLTRGKLDQIERARQAVTLLEQGVSILDVAHEVGYYDQPHLTRSLRRFIGRTPGQIRRVSQAQWDSSLFICSNSARKSAGADPEKPITSVLGEYSLRATSCSIHRGEQIEVSVVFVEDITPFVWLR